MARSPDRFEGLTVFLTVAGRKSFRAAAAELGVTAGAVSQSIRALERRVGLPLFTRTTRSVGLTEAGEKLYARLAPAAGAIGAALDELDGLRERPSGLLRLTVPQLAVPFVLAPVLPVFRREHPDVELEVCVDNSFVDLAEGGFDAGVRIGDAVAKDMVAVRLTPDLRWMVVASPSYLAEHGRPERPEDLLSHQCVRYRFENGALYRWELEDDGREIVIDAPGSVTVNDGALALLLARQGLALAYVADLFVSGDLARGELVPVLERFSPRGPGLHLYFPAGAQTQSKLRAFIDTALSVLSPRGEGRVLLG